MREKQARAGRAFNTRAAIRYVPVLVIVGLFAGYTAVLTCPALFSSDQAFQASTRELDRIVFTTYFNWYNSTGVWPGSSPHVIDPWSTNRTDFINGGWFPSNWPGPRDVNTVVRNVSGQLYKDAMTYHPPAVLPAYTATGDLAAAPATGAMENITTWLSPTSPEWNEWELRGMIRAGVDVVMPDYWNNGLPGTNESSQAALAALVSARQSLVTKASLEADAREPATPHPPETYGQRLVPRIAMFFDTTAMRNLWMWNRSMTVYGDDTHSGEFADGPFADLNDPYWQNEFWRCIDRFYSMVNETHSFIWNGSCVVWLYGGDHFFDVGTTVLQYCKAKFLDTYNRTLLFGGHSDWEKAGIDAICDWGACYSPKYPAVKGIPAAAVSPGFYNIGALSVQTPRYIPRDAGRYAGEWQRAMDLGAVWIHIETWNELHEGTGVGWTQEYGFQWIDETAKATRSFHTQQDYNPLLVLNTAEFHIFTFGLVAIFVVGMIVSRRPRVAVRVG